MAIIRPFRAIRPRPDLARQVAALPYDVMSTQEARDMVAGNPYSFLHVDKAEIDLDPGIDLYDPQVYQKAKENLQQMIDEGVLQEDRQACLYIYRQTMQGRSQTGIVACCSIDEYLQNKIKKHEYTRADKEQDRINHVNICDANTGPIFLTYRGQFKINQIIAEWTEKLPANHFETEDGILHTVWLIDEQSTLSKLQQLFLEVEDLYIADGHHRCASGVKVGQLRREGNPDYTGEEEFNFFLAVIFPDEDLYIMDYNRVVQDLNGLTQEQFLSRLKTDFIVSRVQSDKPYRPQQIHTFGMYLGGQWYKLESRAGSFDQNDPVARLDVSILQNNLLKPILGIDNPRTDKRIDFVGGIRGLGELERRVQEGMQVAFSMYPTTIQELMDIADADQIMPPKSTWFEPKLRSGLFIHKLS
ncbi:Uncharacterised conserved protein UCP033563 [Syntrophomonas zehnderi OL-4]|uniref:Uncharacterized conserved protein UCP033563 n=1 Tax=Syntrophomonas zehnderi OL-4 TaxID=690567 RepID=A0A0E4C838_9FIRM|nr:DUF1015 family protein [Syntrophomonas zehnderi]CFX26254.1 Uncharacterised conserved protein UCP033563 [Syntrophomonas zehnderi OL-4]